MAEPPCSDVQDSIWGTVRPGQLCSAFLTTPELFRLRFIAMGHADYLYPAMSYSRWEHSISVMHLAQTWARKLTSDARLIELVSLAGLCHDAGHVTLGHTLDEYLVRHRVAPAHEERSAQVVRQINRRLALLSSNEEDFVCAAILGQTGTLYPAWAYQVVHHPVRTTPDADRVAYLVHDAQKLGFPCALDVAALTDGLHVNPADGTLAFYEHAGPQLRHAQAMRRLHLERVFRHPRVDKYQRHLLTQFVRLYGYQRLVQDFRGATWLSLTDLALWAYCFTDPCTMDPILRRRF